jgi:hypothetical protein
MLNGLLTVGLILSLVVNFWQFLIIVAIQKDKSEERLKADGRKFRELQLEERLRRSHERLRDGSDFPPEERDRKLAQFRRELKEKFPADWSADQWPSPNSFRSPGVMPPILLERWGDFAPPSAPASTPQSPSDSQSHRSADC